MSLNLRQVQDAIANEIWFVATRQLVTRAPKPAMMAMKDLVDLYEKINDLSLREIVNKLEAPGSGGEPEWYGEAEMATGAAMAAAALRGTSASLDNRIIVPSFTVKLTGDELTWEGGGARRNPPAALAVRCPICGAAPGSVCKVAGRVGSAATKYATHPGRIESAQLALRKNDIEEDLGINGNPAPEIGYDRWSFELGRAAAKTGARIAYGPQTHDAWKAGKTPMQYAKEAARQVRPTR